jgi:hypothetical protein
LWDNIGFKLYTRTPAPLVKLYGDGGLKATWKLVTEQRQVKFLLSEPSLVAVYRNL